VHLANPSAIQQYEGLKHADDKHDAFWLAEMLRLGILPEGYSHITSGIAGGLKYVNRSKRLKTVSHHMVA
jgi:hypothetical protein